MEPPLTLSVARQSWGDEKRNQVLQSCDFQRLVGGFFPPSTVQVAATQTWERVQLK